MTMTSDSPLDVLVVGAGFGGLYATYAARQAGMTVVCLESGSDIGGTWYFNRYPGARCDVESVDYSYSFDEQLQQEWQWSERYATQPEILAYIHHVAERFDLRRSIRLNTTVTAAHFDEAQSRWWIRTESGDEYRARYVVFATGSLSVPHRPDIPGFDTFSGEILYTAQWPEVEPDFTGRRVAVIGTGSSGIQSVPIIAQDAAQLTVFQRTPNYSVPVPNRSFTEDDQARIQAEYPERRAQSRVSGGGSPHRPYPKRAVDCEPEERRRVLEDAWHSGGVLFSKAFPDQFTDIQANDYAREFAEDKIRQTVQDPKRAEQLIPTDHPIGTKRICTDDGYYETFNRENVDLVDLRAEPMREVTENGIATSEGFHEFDTIVLATGFDALTGALNRIDLRGQDQIRIQDAWQRGPQTYLGMVVPEFPNMFLINGPGSTGVLANMVMHAEVQVDWIMRLVLWARDQGYSQVGARPDVAEKWTSHVAEIAASTLFARAQSWYTGANIDGKPNQFMLYAAGLGKYTEVCTEVESSAYEGLVFTAP